MEFIKSWILDQLTFNFICRVQATNGKAENRLGWLERKFLGVLYLRYKGLDLDEVVLGNKILKDYAKLQQTIDKYKASIEYRKTLVDRVDNSIGTAMGKSAPFELNIPLFPLQKPDVILTDKDRLGKIIKVVEGAFKGNNSSQAKLDAFEKIKGDRDKKQKVYTGKTSSDKLTDTSEPEMTVVDLEADKAPPKGNHNNQGKKGNNQHHNKPSGSGYSEPTT